MATTQTLMVIINYYTLIGTTKGWDTKNLIMATENPSLLLIKSCVIVQQYTVWIEVTVSGSFYWVVWEAIPPVTTAGLNGSIEHLRFWEIVDGAQLLYFVTQWGTEEKPTEVTSYFWSEENKENGVGKPLTWITNTLHRERKKDYCRDWVAYWLVFHGWMIGWMPSESALLWCGK